MVDSRKEQPVANEHFREHGYTVPAEIVSLVVSGELKDLSWHNDAAPSYGIDINDEVMLAIWVDHVDPKKRDERMMLDRRFHVSAYNHDPKRLALANDGEVISTDDVGVAIQAFRTTVVDIKRMLEDRKPKVCEECNVALTPDLQCPKCNVSHTADACATCGRHGYHKADCTEAPGFDTEGGPGFKG